MSQNTLVSDHLAGLVDTIAGADDDFSERVIRWCIQNVVPLRQFSGNDLHIVFYEDLCMHPARELDRIFRYLGWHYSPDVLSRLTVPSPVSRGESAINKGTDLISSWVEHVDKDQIDSGLAILREFSLDSIYSESPSPDPAGLQGFLDKQI